MKRRINLLILALLIVSLAAACGSSPKSRADEFLKYMPEKPGDWKLNDKDTVKLLSSTISSMGHIILQYEGPDDSLAYVVIKAYPSEDAADVAATDQERLWLLQGLEISSDRAPQKATARVAQTDRVRYALFQEDTIVVEIDALAASPDTPVSDDAFDVLMTAVRNAYEPVTG